MKTIISKFDEETNYKLAVITHYIQTHELDVSKYYRDKALKYLQDEDLINLLSNIEWDIPFPPTKKPMFTFIDLFAGIGGMRIAFQNLGGKCVFSSEWDRHAQITYESNFGEIPFGDIT